MHAPQCSELRDKLTTLRRGSVWRISALICHPETSVNCLCLGSCGLEVGGEN